MTTQTVNAKPGFFIFCAQVLHGALAVVIGYIVMVLGLFVAQDLTFGRVYLSENPSLFTLTGVGIGSLLAAMIGGMAASWIWRYRPAPQFVMCGLTFVEASYLYISGKGGNPLWFDLLAESTLVVGIVAGTFLTMKYLNKSN